MAAFTVCPSPGLTLLGPSSCKIREPLVLQPKVSAPRFGTQSVPLVAGSVVTSCTKATWYKAWSTSSRKWVPDAWLISHLHAFRVGLAYLSGPRVRPEPALVWDLSLVNLMPYFVTAITMTFKCPHLS